jgi:hypothetical protein
MIIFIFGRGLASFRSVCVADELRPRACAGDAAAGHYIGPASLGRGDFQVSCSILLRFTRGAFGLLWKNLKRLVYMERLTNPLARSRPNPRTKQKT